MNIKASGRSALILATGLFVCFAGPSQAAGTADAVASPKAETAANAPVVLGKYAKHSARHGKNYAHRKSSKLALKSDSKKDATTGVAADNGDNSSAMSSSVANANAEMAVDQPGGNAKAMTARANDILQAAPASTQTTTDTQVVAADQINDVDRALHEGSPPAATLAMASADAPAASVAASSNSNEGSAWDQTSLIGKIFIGFGALLTMASAARMFMA